MEDGNAGTLKWLFVQTERGYLENEEYLVQVHESIELID